MISELIDGITKIVSELKGDSKQEHNDKGLHQNKDTNQDKSKDKQSSSSKDEEKDIAELKTKTYMFGGRIYDDLGQKIPTLSDRIFHSLNPLNLIMLKPIKEPFFIKEDRPPPPKDKTWEDIKKNSTEKEKDLFANPIISKIEEYQKNSTNKQQYNGNVDFERFSKYQEEHKQNNQKSQGLSL